MADVSNIEINGTSYAVKDASAARRNVYYGTCTTAANTYKKVATVETFPLDGNGKPLVGTVVAIKFSNSNSYKTEGQTYQLNVNSTDDYPMYYNNAELATSTSANTLVAGYKNRHIFYMFDGSHWVWLTASYDSNTTYSGMTQAEVDAGTSTTNRLISPQRLRDNFYTEHEVDTLLGTKANSVDLATVATSGSYNDLTNKPTIPAAVTVDSSLTGSSQTNPVQGGAIYSALAGKEDAQVTWIKFVYDEDNDDIWFGDLDDNTLTDAEVRALFNNRNKNFILRETGGDVLYIPLLLDEDEWWFYPVGMPTYPDYGFTWRNGAITVEYSTRTTYVPTSRKINNKPLSTDITLTASDVGAMSTSHPANAITSAKIAEWDAKADPVPIVTVSTTGAVTQALDPNKFYNFTGSPTSLTLTLTSGTGLCIYAGKFTAGTGFSNFTLPSTVKVADGAPSVEAGNTYEFSVMNNLLLLAKEGE